MTLSEIDIEIFWDVWLGLLAFVNDKYKISPNFGHPKEPSPLTSEDVRPLKDKLWEDVSLIDEYIKLHPGMSRLKTRILKQWKRRVKGEFLIVRCFDDYTVFMDEGKNLWGVWGISCEIEEILSGPLPRYVDAVLLPFKDFIIYDTVLLSHNIKFVGNSWQNIENDFKKARKKGMRIGFTDFEGKFNIAPVPEDESPPSRPRTAITKDFKDMIQRAADENPDASIDDINKKLKGLMEEYNNKGRKEFDGLSPVQMGRILDEDFGKNGVSVKPDCPQTSTLVAHAKKFLNMLSEAGEVALIDDCLPDDVVHKIFEGKANLEDLASFPDDISEEAFDEEVFAVKSITAALVEALCEASSFTKRRNGKLSLTRRGKEALENDKLFAPIFKAFCEESGWGCGYLNFDEDEDERFENVGSYGYPFTLYLLSKYGAQPHPVSFYAKKYRRAFFNKYKDKEDIKEIEELYAMRVCECFLVLFDFIEVTRGSFSYVQSFKLTPLFYECLDINI